MRMCGFPGCQRLHGHPANMPHAMWDAAQMAWVPLAEQRTHAEQMRERRDRINREKAERIARKALDRFAYEPGDRLSFTRALDVATAAALQALTDKENAR